MRPVVSEVQKTCDYFLSGEKMRMLSHKKPFIFVLLILLVITVFFLDSMYCYSLSSRVVNAKHALYIARKRIKWYKTQTGNYPLHLSTIQEYAKGNSLSNRDPNTIRLFQHDLQKERITSFSGNSVEYNELNGQGGFFYNSDTGEVKLNITKPLKECFWFYFLIKDCEEIPSEW